MFFRGLAKKRIGKRLENRSPIKEIMMAVYSPLFAEPLKTARLPA